MSEKKSFDEQEVLVVDGERLKLLQTWARIDQKDEAEDQYLSQELTRQLQEMVAQLLDPDLDESLAEIDRSTAYGVDLELRAAPLREDVVAPWPDIDSLLAQGPQTQDRFFVVPLNTQSQFD